MSEANQNRVFSWRAVAAITSVGCLLSFAVAWTGYEWLANVFLGTLLSFITALVWRSRVKAATAEPSLLETPFYLAHDAEIFDRYRQLAHEMLRISGRTDQIYRQCALESLDTAVTQIATVGDGKIIFNETETWRLVYEKLLRDPSVTVYRSVALVRHPDYWQDGAGSQSMQLNFDLISKSIVTVERSVIVADELWPSDSDMPVELVRQWIHEQSVHGIWMRLVRESALRSEPDLVRDMGIYGFSAVGFQEFDAEHLRMSLNPKFYEVSEPELLRLGFAVYAECGRRFLMSAAIQETPATLGGDLFRGPWGDSAEAGFQVSQAVAAALDV